jgi:hypothetical protein
MGRQVQDLPALRFQRSPHGEDFLHSAGDSQDDGVIWAYRYKNKH